MASVQVVDWYTVALSKIIPVFSPDLTGEEVVHAAHFWSPVAASSFAVFLIYLLSRLSGLSKINPANLSDEEILPPSRFGLIAFFEICWNVVSSTLESTLGEKAWQRFLPLLGGSFFFIIVVNLSGVVPGFHPASTSMSFTFAAAMIIFLMFNYYGFKEAGWHYITHMAGPVLLMAPLIFVIELVSVIARPISLSLRLMGNVAGDHSVFGIFSDLFRGLSLPFIPIPAIFVGFGTFVACLQAFIFMTLSAVYIKLALESKGEH